jgi:hypothetical protein
MEQDGSFNMHEEAGTNSHTTHNKKLKDVGLLGYSAV